MAVGILNLQFGQPCGDVALHRAVSFVGEGSACEVVRESDVPFHQGGYYAAKSEQGQSNTGNQQDTEQAGTCGQAGPVTQTGGV